LRARDDGAAQLERPVGSAGSARGAVGRLAFLLGSDDARPLFVLLLAHL
jgi:hypothetical protein